MEIPLRTAYGQNGRCDMQPKAKYSLRAQAQLMRTETVETVELVKSLRNQYPEQPPLTALVQMGIKSNREWMACSGTDAPAASTRCHSSSTVVVTGEW
ncbi:hypothetical protein TNCV_2302901 [Trichonephila clavipes]|nr:hypothetical protein TNCV_2302901 [Trichonephila clavipes]